MIATDIPPWKAEYLEKKRRKEKNDEVPLWKRELLKRIHSKNQRITEEQADIVEEHIPKVSDNIFLVHEKKYRSVPAPRVKVSKQSDVTSPKSPVSVENVIIIEKEQSELNDMSASGEEVSVKEEPEKEYPSAGIVHRLMGRFQKGKTAGQRSVYHPPPYQRSRSAELIEEPAQVTAMENTPATPTPKPATMIESTPSDMESRTTTPGSSDYISPLLISSAKPFSRHAISNAKEHKFHHVDIPVRKISSSSGPLSPSFEQEGPKTTTSQSSIDSIDAFTADLSNLHSNREVISPQKKVENKAEPAEKEKTVERRVNLVNGDSLHSSGNAETTATEPIVAEVPKRRLQDKSNFTSYASTPKPKDADVKTAPQPARHSRITKQTLESESKVIISTKRQDSKPIPPVMKENRAVSSPAKKSDKNKDAFKEVVNESFDEATMKSAAAVAANRIMKSSKTFKITPKKPAQNGAKVPNTRASNTQTAAREERVPPQQERTKIKVAFTPEPAPPKSQETQERKKIEVEFVPDASPVRRLPKEAETHTPNNLPSTSIDDIVTEPPKNVTLLITPATTLSASKGENSIDTKKEKQTVTVSPVPAARATKETKPSNSITVKPNASPVMTKASGNQNRSVFGPKLTNSGPKKGGFGKSFVIDPSKFRKTSAAQQTNASSGVVRESGNTRTIVPNRAQGAAPGTDDVTDAPKSGKRKLTVDQITVIGGYVSLERSCLKNNKRKKESVTISFREKELETTFTYVSERSMLVEEDRPPLPAKDVPKTPGFGKDSTIGKYTPKYLLSMKDNILDEEEDLSEQASGKSEERKPNGAKSQPEQASTDATPLSDDSAIAWSDTTSGSTDILF